MKWSRLKLTLPLKPLANINVLGVFFFPLRVIHNYPPYTACLYVNVLVSLGSWATPDTCICIFQNIQATSLHQLAGVMLRSPLQMLEMYACWGLGRIRNRKLPILDCDSKFLISKSCVLYKILIIMHPQMRLYIEIRTYMPTVVRLSTLR
jgi:hypothetical protein